MGELLSMKIQCFNNSNEEDPKQEIIVISGGPGTGKTIVGIRFILEYVNLFNNGRILRLGAKEMLEDYGVKQNKEYILCNAYKTEE